jgi:hypothetical protein
MLINNSPEKIWERNLAQEERDIRECHREKNIKTGIKKWRQCARRMKDLDIAKFESKKGKISMKYGLKSNLSKQMEIYHF